jgi:hypothetical protein
VDTPNPSSVSTPQIIHACHSPNATLSPPFVVGLALREQVLDVGQVPVGTKDVSVDVVITPDETIQVIASGDS